MEKILIVFGTRPEFIKLLPLFDEIRKRGIRDQFIYIYTGQQADFMPEIFSVFGFSADLELKVEAANNSLAKSFSGILAELEDAIKKISLQSRIRFIVAQGDTTSCSCAAMAAFFNKIPFAHIESGLRTSDLKSPFPEEYYRRSISMTADLHFAPTETAKLNLLKEGINSDKIKLTGNTIVDAVPLILGVLRKQKMNDPTVLPFTGTANNIIITCHRRENQGKKFDLLIESIKELAEMYPEFNFLWLSHFTPDVSGKLKSNLFVENRNIQILPPLPPTALYHLYSNTKLVITDSGGIQEEAASFSLPVIVIREKTERTESSDLNYSRLSNLDAKNLINAFQEILAVPGIKMKNPYGDGQASKRILDTLLGD